MMPTLPVETLDARGRTPISTGMKAQLAADLALLDGATRNGRPVRCAGVLVGDETGARLLIAAKLGDSWKIAGGAGWQVGEKRLNGHIGIEWMF